MKDFTSLIDELHSWVTDTKDHSLPLEVYLLLCASETALRELQEKQTPKKPHFVQYDGNPKIGNHHCPTCDRIIELEPIDHNEKVFCLHCGQALDWGD